MNGCLNRNPFQGETLMQDGWTYVEGTRLPNMVKVPFRMSSTCQYQKDPMGYGQQDPHCQGCKHKEDQ